MEVNDDESVVAISTLLLSYALKMNVGKTRRQRKVWVKGWIREREMKGAYNVLLCDVSLLTDREDYRRFMRMNSETFHELLGKIRPYIEGKTTVMRKPVSAEEKLAVTLRFLATGESYNIRRRRRRYYNVHCHRSL